PDDWSLVDHEIKNIASFDMKFLNKKIKKWGGLYFRNRTMDPAILYWQKGDKELPDMKTCFERAGIRKEVTHDACEDALDIIRLIRHKMLNDTKAIYNPLAFAGLCEMPNNFPKKLTINKNLTINKEYNVYSRKINENGIGESYLIKNDIGQEIVISDEYFDPLSFKEIDSLVGFEDKELFKEKVNLKEIDKKTKK
ncbi:MAG: hypothetical protein WCG45_05660, partial [bacterium]